MKKSVQSLQRASKREGARKAGGGRHQQRIKSHFLPALQPARRKCSARCITYKMLPAAFSRTLDCWLLNLKYTLCLTLKSSKILSITRFDFFSLALFPRLLVSAANAARVEQKDLLAFSGRRSSCCELLHYKIFSWNRFIASYTRDFSAVVLRLAECAASISNRSSGAETIQLSLVRFLHLHLHLYYILTRNLIKGVRLLAAK